MCGWEEPEKKRERVTGKERVISINRTNDTYDMWLCKTKADTTHTNGMQWQICRLEITSEAKRKKCAMVKGAQHTAYIYADIHTYFHTAHAIESNIAFGLRKKKELHSSAVNLHTHTHEHGMYVYLWSHIRTHIDTLLKCKHHQQTSNRKTYIFVREERLL